MEQKGLSKSRTEVVEQERTLFDTVGDELRRARKSQSLTVEDVAQKLNIKTTYISALENNDYAAFPAIVYGVGFLRTYALFLGLEPESLISRFKNETNHLNASATDVVIPSQHNILPTKKTIGICVVLLIGLYCIWYGFMKTENHAPLLADMPIEAIEASIPVRSQMPTPIVTAPVESDTILNQNIEIMIDDLKSSDLLENAMDLPIVAEIPSSQPITDDGSAPSEQKLPVVLGMKYGVEENAVIILMAKERSWINVQENGKTVFDQILAKGDAYYVPADKNSLIMHTGNARGLDVYVNGQARGVVSKTETVKKNILLSPETFKHE